MGTQKMDSSELFHRVRDLLATLPNLTEFDGSFNLPEPTMLWIGRAAAVLEATGAIADYLAFTTASDDLIKTYRSEENARKMVGILHRSFARLELAIPSASRGTFVTAGSQFDAFAAVGQILSTATASIMIVDPYMDELALTDFAVTAPPVPTYLLAGDKTVKPGLSPATKHWVTQFGNARPIEVRVAASNLLHDRVIIIDGKTAWILTQSLKDFAKRSPGSLQQSDPELAAMKIAAYTSLWSSATLLT